MYTRAKRQLSEPRPETLEHVGPGTYERHATRLPPDQPAPLAPFGTSALRQTVIEADIRHGQGRPSPGTYDIATKMDRAKGGTSVSNRSQRFVEEPQRAPPPGAYAVKSTLRVAQPAPGKLRRERGFGTLKGRHMASSIPSRQEIGGFQVDETTGSLVKVAANNGNPEALGPNSYNVRPQPHSTTQRYKDRGFGARTGHRVLELTSKVQDGPSPGDYHQPIAAKGRSPSAKQNVGFSTTRRPMSPEKPVAPSPDAYKLPSPFDGPPSMEPSVLGGTAERFPDPKFQPPPPGAYEETRSALKTAPRDETARNPFGQTSRRFEEEHSIRETPGPAGYHTDAGISSGVYNAVRKRATTGTTAPFGTTGVRTAPFFAKEATLVPAPGTYAEAATRGLSSSRGAASAFSSQSPRMAPIKPQAPPATSYDVAQSFESSQSKLGKYSKAKQSFGSKTKRELQLNASGAATWTPAPSTYEFPPLSSKGGRLADRSSTRFKVPLTDAPPPTTYTLGPEAQNSTFKRTFNVTLGMTSSSA
eukprot:m.301200 g.301200  ORF g.301200 m.301200 type:complete len:530 (+) comp14672_c0_seq1:18-1607(+)